MEIKLNQSHHKYLDSYSFYMTKRKVAMKWLVELQKLYPLILQKGTY